MQQRTFDLVRRERHPVRRHPVLQQRCLCRRKVRYPELPHLSVTPERGKGRRDFVGIHQRIGTMHQQQVEPVGAQRAQRLLDRRDDMRGPRVVVLDPVRGPARGYEPDPALRDDPHPFAQVRRIGQHVAEQALGRIVAVDVRMVETRHAEFQRCLDQRATLADRQRPVADPPHPEHDARERRGIGTHRYRRTTFRHRAHHHHSTCAPTVEPVRDVPKIPVVDSGSPGAAASCAAWFQRAYV